ncbi:sugar ABC transporter substrate-binding protein [Gordonia sp. NPDC003376]
MPNSRNPRRLLATAAAVLTLSLGSALVACSGDTGSDSSARIAYFTMGLSNSYLTSATDASKKVADDEGVAMDVFSADFDSAKQLTQIQDAVSSGKYKALVVESIDGQTVCKSLTDAAETMVVAIYNTPICGDLENLYTPGTLGFFGRDEAESGRLFAEYTAKALPQGGHVAYVPGPSESSIVQLTSRSFANALNAHPDITVAATVPGNWDSAQGLSATQDILQSHPDIDAIVYGDDNSAAPSVKWLVDNGKLGSIKIISLGGSSTVVDMIKSGHAYADIAGLPVEESTRAVQAAIQTIKGQPVNVPGWDAASHVYNVLKDPMFNGGDPVITAANADGFTAVWSVG